MLLKTAGAETVRELARRNPEHVYEKLMQVNEQEHVVDLLPSLEQVTDGIGQAQGEAREPEEGGSDIGPNLAKAKNLAK